MISLLLQQKIKAVMVFGFEIIDSVTAFAPREAGCTEGFLSVPQRPIFLFTRRGSTSSPRIDL